MTNKFLIIIVVLLAASVTFVAAREILLTIEMTGTVTTSTELTLYKLGDPGYIWADVGDPVTSITIPSLAEGTTVDVGSYYLVNTGSSDVTVTYDTQETTQNLPFIVNIRASEAWVNGDGSVNEVGEKVLYWYYEKTPYSSVYNEDGTIKVYRYSSFTLTGGYDWMRGSNGLELGITLSAVNVDVAFDTPFTLQLSFYSEETS
jgi:hypothetical protein